MQLDGNFTAGAPLYEQIARKLEDDILRGILQEDQQAPSTNELSRAYAINPATAAKGLNLLVEEGVLYKRRGIGMFVARGAQEALRARRKDRFYTDYIVGLVREAQRLDISAEELAQMIHKASSAKTMPTLEESEYGK